MKKHNYLSEIAIHNAENVKKEMHEKGEYISLTRGSSMRPLFREHRDVVVIAPLSRQPRKYDVLLYTRINKDDLVLHRVLKVREKDYIIRGDNTYSFEYIPKDDVIGILKEFYRNGKYVNCETNCGYRFYAVFITKINCLVKMWYSLLKPFLSKIKHGVLGTLHKTN